MAAPMLILTHRWPTAPGIPASGVAGRNRKKLRALSNMADRPARRLSSAGAAMVLRYRARLAASMCPQTGSLAAPRDDRIGEVDQDHLAQPSPLRRPAGTVLHRAARHPAMPPGTGRASGQLRSGRGHTTIRNGTAR